MTTYITTKDTAKMVRQALRNAFPGQKFSVRCGTGTGSAWMHVSWIDGPTTRQVDAIVGHYEGRRFNGMTDSYDDAGTALVAFEGAEMPEVVRYCCDGINTSRSFSPAGYLFAQELVRKSDASTFDVCSAEGQPIHRGGVLPEAVAIEGHVFHDFYSPAGLADQILHARDLCGVLTQ
jgi:hypothetical protein